MKLRNKILPIVGVLATGCTLAPFATSCKKNVERSGWLIANYDTYENPEEAGLLKADPEDLPEPEQNLATIKYAKAISENKQIVYDDYRFWLSTLDKVIFDIPYLLYLIMPPDMEFSMVYSDVNTLRGQMSDFSVDTDFYTLTYDLELKFDIDFCIEVSELADYGIDPQLVFCLRGKFNAHYDRCPFFVGPDLLSEFLAERFPEYHEWLKPSGGACILNFQKMMSDPFWSEDIGLDLTFEVLNQTIDFGLGFASKRNISINFQELALLDLVKLPLVLLGEVFGGWSGYYYSDLIWGEGN